MAQADIELLTAALAGYEQRRSEIDEKIAELRSRLGTGRDRNRPAEIETAGVQTPRKRRRMSAAARKRIGDAQRKRWAAVRGEAEPAAARKAPRKKRR